MIFLLGGWSAVGAPYEFGIGLCTFYQVFFFVGYLISEKLNGDMAQLEKTFSYRNNDKSFFRNEMTIILFLICSLTWRRNGHPVFYNLLMDVFKNQQLLLLGAKVFILAFRYLTPFLGIAFSFIFCGHLLHCPKKILNAVAFTGNYTLEIYVIHEYILRLTFCSFDVVNIFIKIILGISIPVFIALFTKNMHLFQLIFFGKK